MSDEDFKRASEIPEKPLTAYSAGTFTEKSRKEEAHKRINECDITPTPEICMLCIAYYRCPKVDEAAKKSQPLQV